MSVQRRVVGTVADGAVEVLTQNFGVAGAIWIGVHVDHDVEQHHGMAQALIIMWTGRTQSATWPKPF